MPKKKQLRIAIFVSPQYVTPIYQTMLLAFGKSNVAYFLRAEDIFGALTQWKPTTLILEPELFHLAGISAEDICALQKKFRCKIVTVYPTEESLSVREAMAGLHSEKEYICPKEYLSMVMELPRLSTNRYVKVKRPLERETMENLDRIFRDCGFHCNMKGAPLLKEALYMMYFDPDLHKRGGGKKVVDRLAEKYGYSPRVVERSMIRFLESSWSYQTEQRLREELKIHESHSLTPLCFKQFTEIFNTYYTLKYKDPTKVLSRTKKH